MNNRAGADCLLGRNNVRFIALDGLRGLAAIVVILYHLRWPNHLTSVTFIQNGYLAVDLFFILSGFVICASYLTRIIDGPSVSRFLWLRFFRIYPLHFAVLLGLVILEFSKLWFQKAGFIIPGQEPFHGRNSPQALIANAFLVQSFGLFDHLSWNIPAWTISCESITYLIFGFTALTGLLRTQSTFAVGTLLAFVSYGVLALTNGTLDITYGWGLVRCLSGFLLGATIFEITNSRAQWRLGDLKRSIAAIEIALTGSLVFIMSVVSGAAIVSVIPIFIGLVAVLQLDSGPVARVLISPLAQFLGRISYSIYMVQFGLIVILSIGLKRVFNIALKTDPLTNTLVPQFSPWIGDILVLLFVLAVIATSTITYAFIEAPARNWGRRFLDSLKS